MNAAVLIPIATQVDAQKYPIIALWQGIMMILVVVWLIILIKMDVSITVMNYNVLAMVLVGFALAVGLNVWLR